VCSSDLISELSPAAYNPRVIDPAVLEKLAKGIKTYGFVEPLVVNKRKDRLNTIIGGHQRLKAAESLGMAEVPCVYVDLDEKNEKALNIALNKLSGEWLYPKLTAILKEFEALPEFDMELTGFDKMEFKDLEMPDVAGGGTLFDIFSGSGSENSSRLEPAKMTIVSVGAFIQGVKKESSDKEYAEIHRDLRELVGRLQVEGSDTERVLIATAIAKAAYREVRAWAKSKAN